METFLYVFGYETPGLAGANKRQHTDFEDSMSFFIVAKNKEQALEWGERLADEYIRVLYNNPSATRKSHGSAGWIEDDYARSYSVEGLAKIVVVNYGAYPDMVTLVGERYGPADLNPPSSDSK